VLLHLPDQTTMELGTGEIFGEVALATGTDLAAKVTSLGYSRLLMLLEGDFDTVLARDEALREKIQAVVKQRQRAIEVWRQFQSGERQHEPLPDLGSGAGAG
jgi:CPA1 family monovalent cation:H+ antiporter